MKNSRLVLALLAAGLAGQAQAALVAVPFQYRLAFVDPTVAAELAFASSGLFSGSVTFDDSSAPDALGVYNATAFNVSFGSFNLTQADNMSPFAVGVGVGATNNLTSLYFEAALTLNQVPGAGNYLLSFFGADAQLTPEGDTFDYKVTAAAVPLPATLPLLLAGVGLMGWIGRRRSQR